MSYRIERTISTNSDITDHQKTSLSMFSTWWSGSSSTTVNSSKNPTETNDGMDWEPSGPEIELLQKRHAHKIGHPSSSSLPSSPPSSGTFPISMIKYSKVTTSPIRECKGSEASTHDSLTSLLWNKFAASQDNIATTATTETPSTTDIVEAVVEEISPASSPVDANSINTIEQQKTTSQLDIVTLNSEKKRWSLFGYGAKDSDDDNSSLTKLRKNGDVLIETDSRPSSINEANIEDSTIAEPAATASKPNIPSSSLTQSSAPIKTELANAQDERGPIAPALVGISELSVVVPPETIMSNTENPAPDTSGATSSTYSWLSIIPGYGTKTDDATIAKEDARSSHQVTDYEEGERKDIHGDTVHFKEKPNRRTFAELADARSSLEDLPSKEGLKDKLKDGLESGQHKEHESQESRIVKETGKAVASLSKVVLKKKNVVLPNYYEQFPDVRQSLITLPAGQADIPTQGVRRERSSSIMTSAVNTLSSLLFSKVDSAHSSPSSKEDLLHRGANGVKKVAIIGVHGWFPVKLIRTVIGEPTGTSKKFCDEMNLALKDYLKQRNVELEPDDITLIPLEGEGKVLDRVDILYENLIRNEKWKMALHEADLVLVATHSQGTPTSTLLVSRLINEGMLRVKEEDPRMQRVGILAMAGISHGPFPFLKGNLIVRWFEAEAAQELFEFMDSETDIAIKYREALRTVLVSGVRITYVASLEDQVVPLYSAIMTSIHHPSIVRAVYADGCSYQDDFLTNLIAFALRLRNSGVEDHGVLVHLSEVVAGSIYGEGHSTIYDEREVYLLSIRALLEPPTSLTSEMIRSEPIFHPFRAKHTLNPFYLPWGMRGVMDELKALGNKALDEEMERLKELYDEWDPVSKGMKEIKFRLEPLRFKL
ncbi:hypothetical protein BG011_002994 [Mortierella polycephala]|uniref:YMC020W-like alpha/beta hydrolase domain-containing protein n=1 Tax=Mortierella polycephala TaxID=41804 RepID=A0A9P6U484_9FUNG|nr:hypothetical protein BG011_002994 [Mortierella polycephala]